MSIGLTLKVAYRETCEICDKIAHLTSVAFQKIIDTFEAIGTARAASQLAQMGYYEEAKYLMLESKKKWKVSLVTFIILSAWTLSPDSAGGKRHILPNQLTSLTWKDAKKNYKEKVI